MKDFFEGRFRDTNNEKIQISNTQDAFLKINKQSFIF